MYNVILTTRACVLLFISRSFVNGPPSFVVCISVSITQQLANTTFKVTLNFVNRLILGFA